MNEAQKKVIEERLAELKQQLHRLNAEIAELHEGIAGKSTITLGGMPLGASKAEIGKAVGDAFDAMAKRGKKVELY